MALWELDSHNNALMKSGSARSLNKPVSESCIVNVTYETTLANVVACNVFTQPLRMYKKHVGGFFCKRKVQHSHWGHFTTRKWHPYSIRSEQNGALHWMLTASSGVKWLGSAQKGCSTAFKSIDDENAKKSHVKENSVLIVRDIFVAASH